MAPPRPTSRNAAVALSYDGGTRRASSPRATASSPTPSSAPPENGLYVHESRELVGLLMQVDLDAHIPPQLYVAVAELLAWLYRLESREIPADAARRPIYLSKESPPCWTPAIRNFCSPGRKTCVPRCSSSPTPTATSWCATPPIARSPCSSWGGQAHAPVLLASARLRRRGLRTIRQHGPAQRHHLPLHATAYGGVQIRFPGAAARRSISTTAARPGVALPRPPGADPAAQDVPRLADHQRQPLRGTWLPGPRPSRSPSRCATSRSTAWACAWAWPRPNCQRGERGAGRRADEFRRPRQAGRQPGSAQRLSGIRAADDRAGADPDEPAPRHVSLTGEPPVSHLGAIFLNLDARQENWLQQVVWRLEKAIGTRSRSAARFPRGAAADRQSRLRAAPSWGDLLIP